MQRGKRLHQTIVEFERVVKSANPDALIATHRVSRAVSNARNEGRRLLDEVSDDSVGLGL